MPRALAIALPDPPPDERRPELDEITLARAQRGDRDAFRRLVELHQRPVFALLSRMLAPSGRQSHVEDLAQETFVRVYRGLATFGTDGRKNLPAWILTIAARLAIDELRRRPLATAPFADTDLLPAHDRTDHPAERRSTLRAIERAVAALSPDHRAVFLLREVHDLDYDSIAEALAIDPGTVKSRLSRARAALRAALTEVQDD